ncbi:MAG: hypothetical protein ACRDXB_04530, partial [Actinomycetes bacterium]
VVVGPLGVARRQRVGSARLLRLLGLVGGIAVFAGANGIRTLGPPDMAGLVFGIGVLALFAVVSLIGPLVVRMLGHTMVRTARSPAALLAGRRLLDDPRGAFRPLAGIVLAIFVAGFVAPLTAAVSGPVLGDDSALRIEAPVGEVDDLHDAVRDRLVDRGIAADVTIADVRGEPGLAVTPALAADRDRIRTALADVVPAAALTEREHDADGWQLVLDLQRGAVVVLVATFLIAATATGTAAAARVLDHRRTLRFLHLAGTPLSVLDAARRAETVQPLLVLAAFGLGLGLLCASPFAAAAGVLEPSGIVVLVAAIGAGTALVVASSAMSRPLLRAVASGASREDR